MTSAEGSPYRVLVLAPAGRDAQIANSILSDAGTTALACPDVASFCAEYRLGAGVGVIVEEAIDQTGGEELAALITDQPAWSDFPFVLLAHRGGGLERNPAATRISAILGNVSFLERPFHPTTLVSVVRTALRGRRRQYEARERLEEIQRAEAMLEHRVHERTAELESANRELASQIVEREKVESALRQAQRLEAVGQLTSGVAHDFNNLLTVVIGTVRMLRKRISDPETTRMLTMMSEAAERGAKLTAQLLAFSRRQKLEPKPVDLNDTVTSMRDMLQSTMGGSVRIETVLSRRLWPALIDPTQIELVILNLAINARDAMEVGGTLIIETANVTLSHPQRAEEPPPGEYVALCVSDTGFGMTPEILARAIEPFFTTKEVGKGSGLGLSQVFGLAKQSGGGVRIDTQVGEGTTVRIYLPRAKQGPALDEGPAVAHTPSPSTRGSLNVLLVDDDSAVREVTRTMLADLGYAVLEAGSAGAALELLSTTQIDIALLDFAMPGMNGAELAKEIRARRPHLPVIFATGYADASALIDESEDRIVQKPFDDRELSQKLSAALTRSRPDLNVVSLHPRRHNGVDP
jgi:signal transduction histidine kinase/ActR/RegA family two-component response regulator